MSEELLNLLARVPGLQVASRTSSFAYKGRNVDIREVGRELGVETVLEGSVRQAGDQVRITAQLIDAETGFHLWSETYDRRLEDIFQVQDEIAAAIVDKLRIELAPQEQQLARARQGADPERRGLRAVPAGPRRLEAPRRGKPQARHRPVPARARPRPGFRPRPRGARLGLRRAARDTPRRRATRRSSCRWPRTSARQALSIDPNIGEAHAVLAQINAERGNLLDAESGFFFAISLEPNEPTPHHWYSILLAQVGRLDAALEQARRAQELDPTSPILASNLANVYLMWATTSRRCASPGCRADLGLSKKNAASRRRSRCGAATVGRGASG